MRCGEMMQKTDVFKVFSDAELQVSRSMHEDRRQQTTCGRTRYFVVVPQRNTTKFSFRTVAERLKETQQSTCKENKTNTIETAEQTHTKIVL